MKNKIKCIRIAADSEQIQACKDNLDLVKSSVRVLSKALSLGGNEVRLKILYLLYKEQRLCVCDLSDILDMSIPAISQHLRKMKDGNIIYNVREAQTLYYSIKEDFLKLFESFFEKIDKGFIPLEQK